MAQPEPGPIPNQEINAAADRIAHNIVAYALSEIRDLLPDGCIAETIADDQDGRRLDLQAHGIVYGLVWDRLGRAAADYQRRDQGLTEGAELIQAQRAAVYADAGRHAADGMDRARDLLLAARTTATQES